MLSDLVKTMIHNMWLENSIPTADRRLGRNVIQIKTNEFLASYHGIEIPIELLEDGFNKRGVAVTRAERRIATCSAGTIIKTLHTTYNQNVSHGSVLKFKPFFIHTATDREKSLCLCKTCLNLRYILTGLMKPMKDQGKNTYSSLSEYYMENCTCPKTDNGYWSYNCCTGKCTDCWNISPPDLAIEDPNVEVSYLEFSVSKFTYTATRGPDKGKPKITKRCERHTLIKSYSDLKLILDKARSHYILHRYLINREKHVSLKIRNSIPEYGDVYWVDMSENIANTPKEQCQDAHFNQ